MYYVAMLFTNFGHNICGRHSQVDRLMAATAAADAALMDEAEQMRLLTLVES